MSQIQTLEHPDQINRKEEQNIITFEELCPQYSTKLSMWTYLTPYAQSKVVNTIMCQSSKCIVGEAHGFSSEYVASCGDCHDFAAMDTGFPTAFSYKGFPQFYPELFENIKQKFMEHWNKEHRY